MSTSREFFEIIRNENAQKRHRVHVAQFQSRSPSLRSLGSGIIRDRHTKNCMSPVLRMRWK